MKTLTIALLIIASLFTVVKADSFAINVGMSTSHIGKAPTYYLDNNGTLRNGFNEDNKILQLEYTFNDFGINMSSFVNSFHNETITLGGSYRYFNSSYFEADVLFGAAKGYIEGQLPTVLFDDISVYIAPRFTVKYEIVKNLEINTRVELFGLAVVTTAGVIYKF